MRRVGACALLTTLVLPMYAFPQTDPELLRNQVLATERAFARSMTERDFAAFARHLSEHAVFWSGPAPLQGKAAVMSAWKPFYDAAQAPFSWDPDQVVVLSDGSLAHSTGLVRDATGRLLARFNSVWRQESPGVWRIVFDRGSPLSEADRKAAGDGPAPSPAAGNAAPGR
jgi:ketosteroid isomerase-like protein